MNTTIDNTQVKVSPRGAPFPGGKVASIADAENEDKHFVVLVDTAEREVKAFREVDGYEGGQQLKEVGKELMEEME